MCGDVAAALEAAASQSHLFFGLHSVAITECVNDIETTF